MSRNNIILDLDNTLMDYRYTNRYAMSCVYKALGIEFDDEEYNKFLEFEGRYWKFFENSRQELDTHGMTRIDYVRSRIYQEYFGHYRIPLQLGYELMNIYISNLGIKNKLYDGVPEVLEYLYEYYNLYIASNGPHESQVRKLENTDILKYFKGIVASDDAGYAKPKKEFFEYLFRKYNIEPDDSALVGDSLTSDILGANDNGLCSIWFNKDGISNPTLIRPDMEIRDIKELKKIL